LALALFFAKTAASSETTPRLNLVNTRSGRLFLSLTPATAAPSFSNFSCVMGVESRHRYTCDFRIFMNKQTRRGVEGGARPKEQDVRVLVPSRDL
jgi:hypothetical protein